MSMRFLLKASFPVEAANKAAKEGRLAKIIESILADLKPEAAYFLDENGERAAYLFFHMEDSSEIPKVAEPWMLALDASIEMHPVMAAEDLMKAAPYIDGAVKKYT
jgi:Domain of unknown function (DUF3303)